MKPALKIFIPFVLLMPLIDIAIVYKDGGSATGMLTHAVGAGQPCTGRPRDRRL